MGVHRLLETLTKPDRLVLSVGLPLREYASWLSITSGSVNRVYALQSQEASTLDEFSFSLNVLETSNYFSDNSE